MKRALKALWHLFAIAGLAAISLLIWFVSQGIGTKAEPSALEAVVARTARRIATPLSARSRQNPIGSTAETIRSGRDHWADHCAGCHGNNGGGDTEIGRGLYPRAPDMRLSATQTLTDGELFFIIENGVKLTGMPAWGNGTPEGEQASWHLVDFIRHLPQLTDEELAAMEELNPRGPEEWRALEEEKKFLAGGNESPNAPAPPLAHKHP